MSKLFIYYSMTGNGDTVAAKMHEMGFDILKVETQKALPKPFLLRMLVGGFQAGTGKRAPLTNYTGDTEGYDTIAIGSPIWNGRLCPAINTVLDKTDLSGKEIMFVLYAGGGEAPKAKDALIAAYPTAKIIVLKEPKSNPDELDKIW